SDQAARGQRYSRNEGPASSRRARGARADTTMSLRDRIARLYRLHPRGERAETGPRRGKAPTGLTWLAREAGVTREAVRQCIARDKASPRIEMVIRRLEYEAGLITTEEL